MGTGRAMTALDSSAAVRPAARLLRAHLQSAALRFGLAALALTGDPVADWMRGSPSTDVYRLYERIRARGPVVHSRLGLYAVTSRSLCDQVLRDPRFGVRRADGGPAFPDAFSEYGTSALEASFVELDPPDHTRLRRAVAPAFRPKVLREWAPRLEALLDEVLQRATGAGRGGPVDLVSQIAAPFPIAVISTMLGIPDAETARFASIGALVGQSLDGVRTVAQAKALRAAELELFSLLARLLDERTTDPRDDVLSVIAAARREGVASASDAVHTAVLLLIAGFETTVNLIGNGVAALLQQPDRWRELVSDPGLAPAVVEETLRWDPSVQGTGRITHTALELAGTPLPKDSVIMIMTAAANRDPEAYARPEIFDLHRAGEPDHLAFSSGIHYCLGAPLARLEGEIVFRALAERFPRLSLAAGARRRPGSTIRGFSGRGAPVPPLSTAVADEDAPLTGAGPTVGCSSTAGRSHQD